VGLGLGLYLARGISEAHGGSLEFDSAYGRGARFLVRLPLEHAQAANEDANLSTTASKQEPRRHAPENGQGKSVVVSTG
jgi:hypothetical protein